MSRAWSYPLLFIFSYAAGLVCFKGAAAAMNIPEESEYQLLHTGIVLFYIFNIIPAYSIITYLIHRLANKHSFLMKAISLVLFGIFPATFVPVFGFGFGHLTAQYFTSEMAVLLYAYFTGSAVVFSIGSSFIERLVSGGAGTKKA